MIGANAHVKIWDVATPTDDVVGGAVPVETVLYDDLHVRLTPVVPNELLLQQGIESAYSYRMRVNGTTKTIREEDEVEIIKPLNHPEAGSRYRIRNIIRSSMHPDDSRGFTTYYLRKRKYAYDE